MKEILLSAFICILVATVCPAAGGGTIRGKITDENGEPAIGATIILKSKPSVGTTTDMDGNYSLKIPDSTTETIVISLLGYKTVEEVVLPFFPVLIRNYSLEPSAKAVKEVQITAKAVKAKEYYMEKVKINSATTLDYISQETMKKTGDANIAAAVARVPGVSTTSNGIFTVRGIGDRYIKTAINGSRIPTLDPFTNNIKLDLFPASLVDNVLITKTASPDLPGDWAGAYLSVETKDYPDQMTVFAETSVGYNDQSTFKDVVSSQHSSTEWLGYDNGFRDHNHSSYVQTIPDPTTYQEFVALGLGDYFKSLGVNGWLANNPNATTYFKLGLVQLGLLGKAQFNDATAVSSATNAYNTGHYRGGGYDIINGPAVKSSQSFPDNWYTTTQVAPLNFTQDFSIGNQVQLFGKPLGLLAGFRYGRAIQYDANSSLFRAHSNKVANGMAVDNDTTDQKISKETNGWSALMSAAYKFSANHSLSLLFMPNMLGVNKVRDGLHYHDELTYSTGVSELIKDQFYESRKQMIYQLKSENYIPGWKLKTILDASYTHGASSAPDFKTATLSTDSTKINSLNVGGHRYFRYLTDNVFDSRLLFEVPISSASSALSRKIKFGASYQRNDKRADQYDYYLLNSQQAVQFIPGNEASDPFSMDKFDIRPVVYNGTNIHTVQKYYQENDYPEDHSIGYSTVKAGFVMMDYAITPIVRVSGGLRVEKAYIYTDVARYDSLGYPLNDPRRVIDQVGINNPGKLNELSYLPSVNIIYKLKHDDEAPVNLRFNFSQTVARPSIRELSDVTVYDYELRTTVTGNPYLKMSQINNYDVRFEYYFKNGDNFSASIFYKNFKNYIELVNGDVVKWINTPNNPSLKGIEMEGRKIIVKNLVATANVTFVDTRSSGSLSLGSGGKYDIYDQAPYVINAILDYLLDKPGLGFNVSYNVQGAKLYIVGQSGVPDVYERPRNLLDAKVSKSLGKHFKVSLKVRDILNSPTVRSYKFSEGYILDYDRYRYGTNYILAVSYKL